MFLIPPTTSETIIAFGMFILFTVLNWVVAGVAGYLIGRYLRKK